MHASPRHLPCAFVVVLLLLAAGCAAEPADSDRSRATGAETGPASTRPAEPAEPRHPADRLPLELLVGELVMTKLEATEATPQELQAVARLHLGGIILFAPNVRESPQLRALLASLDAARRGAAQRHGLPAGVLVSVDQEGGSIRNVPFAPPDLAPPQLSSPQEARSVARAAGAGLRAEGVDIALGPVADLAAGPNRTMAGRSFGEEPQRVAEMVSAYVRGLEEGGVAATVKHFPGFGASTANSDEAVAYVDRSGEELRQAELVPFRSAVDADVDVVMVSHGIHRELGSSVPGTIDPKIVTGLLRDELGYEGVAMTDSMNARGFREAWGDTVPRACPVALAAGIDILLLTGSLETATSCRNRILDALDDGTLPEQRVREAARRVIDLRRRVAD